MNEFVSRMRCQIATLQEEQPLLTDVIERDDAVCISGIFVVHDDYEGEIFTDSFETYIPEMFNDATTFKR